jgi:hypothetical protein
MIDGCQNSANSKHGTQITIEKSSNNKENYYKLITLARWEISWSRWKNLEVVEV